MHIQYESGMQVDELEKRIKSLEKRKLTVRYPYRAAVYTIPVHQNPTGRCLSLERCEKLVKLAREFDLLIISDDVYNVLTYSAPDCEDATAAKPPTRLFYMDKKSDTDYKGNVISLASFSKILAPGLRLGWYEMPAKVKECFQTMFITDSGSAWNEYTSGIVAAGFKSGLLQKHISKTRALFWENIKVTREIVLKELNGCGVECSFPSGGVFMWITLPTGISTDEILNFCKSELTFIPGRRCSISESHQNCLRICISFYDRDVLFPAVRKLCGIIKEFITQQKKL